MGGTACRALQVRVRRKPQAFAAVAVMLVGIMEIESRLLVE